MAVVVLKSTVITNRDAVPKVLTDALVAGQDLSEAEGFVAPANGDSAGSTYILHSVPSNARMSSLIMQNSALGAGARVDLGVYYPSFIPKGAGLDAIAPNQVIDADFFANSVDVSAALGPVEYINQSGSNTIAKQEQSLWQAIGLSADPGIDLDIVATVEVAMAAAGFLGAKSRYAKQ